MRDGSVSDKNSTAANKLRGEATKGRMKRTRQAQNADMRESRAATAAKSAGRNAAAKTVGKVAVRAIPGAGAAMMAGDALGAVAKRSMAAEKRAKPKSTSVRKIRTGKR
jgi:hypothetical protein